MTCDKSTLLRLGIGAAVLLGAAYVLFPAFQAWIAANALILLVLLCPLSMLFMGNMHKNAPRSTTYVRLSRSSAIQVMSRSAHASPPQVGMKRFMSRLDTGTNTHLASSCIRMGTSLRRCNCAASCQRLDSAA